jgi:hypothetical protein
MVQSGSHCLAIEAKWTEPKYPIVSLWLQGKTKHPAPNEPNKDASVDDQNQEPTKDSLQPVAIGAVVEVTKRRFANRASPRAKQPEERIEWMVGGAGTSCQT